MYSTTTQVSKKGFRPSTFFTKVAEECARDVVFPEGFEAFGEDGNLVAYLKVDKLPKEFA